MSHPASERFHAILAEMGELHNVKQADYGQDDDPLANVRASEEWGMPAWVGAMVRLTDKVRRLQTFADKGELANEGAIDSFMDIAVYSIIARILYEQDVETVEPAIDWPVFLANRDDVRIYDPMLDTDSEAHREWRRERGYIDPDPDVALTPEDVCKVRHILTPEEFEEWRAIRGYIDPNDHHDCDCGRSLNGETCGCGLSY